MKKWMRPLHGTIRESWASVLIGAVFGWMAVAITVALVFAWSAVGRADEAVSRQEVIIHVAQHTECIIGVAADYDKPLHDALALAVGGMSNEEIAEIVGPQIAQRPDLAVLMAEECGPLNGRRLD